MMSCENNNQLNNTIIVKHLTDTIKAGEPAKLMAFLDKPSFLNKDASLLVYVENLSNENSLKSDLSNEDEIVMSVYHNFTVDTFNRKLLGKPKGFEDRQCVIFGQKFSTTGIKKIRGYFLEYYGNYHPVYDSFENNYGEKKKVFFEEEIYVKE